MDPLIIERILMRSDLPGAHYRGGRKIVAKPSEKIVLCAIARCRKSDVNMRTGITKTVSEGSKGEALWQKKFCDLLEVEEKEITVAMIARLCGYSWNRASDIIKHLRELRVITDDFRIIGYD